MAGVLHLHRKFVLLLLLLVLLALLSVVLAGCGGGSSSDDLPTLKVGGIPDQDTARLARRYQGFVDYLSQELDVKVEYVPSVDYAAVVTAFTQDELQLAFFGGLTGVQARLRNPGATAIAQREHDAKFHSKFVVRTELPIQSMEDLAAKSADLTITFGSESSTSGHLMPRHFLGEAGINPDTDFRGVPNFSGSHDLTWQLVEGGSFDVGALNEDVWNRAVREGKADPAKVREFYTTPEYYDYNWTVRGNVDEVYGEGFTDRIQEALLKLNTGEHGEILELFSTERFIATENANYRAIEEVARAQGLIK
jgi:phosphonate transport system substrate-binding protein